MNHKGRTIHALLGTCLAAALPCLALASPPSDVAMGQIDAILNYCVKAVPGLEKGAQTYRTLLTGNAAGVRGSNGYQEGYDQVSAALVKGNHGQQIAACTRGLSLRSPDDRNDRHHGRR
jgi:hypothetical protein